MKKTIFAKVRKSADGKAFTTYITKMVYTPTGEEITMSVKFKAPCNPPRKEDCPIIVLIDKKDCNVSKQTYTRSDTGEQAIGYTLWVSEWRPSEEHFEDNSMDDFE